MADFNSKYTGEQVDALLDIVSQGGVGGGGGEGEVQKTTEAEITAMGFTKNLGTITEVKMNGVTKGTSGVVDLGTVITAHQDISGKADNTRVDLISERLDDIDSEMRDFATESQLNNKQDVITDLDTIRQGAAKGNTALQKDAFFMWDIPTNDGGDAIMFGKLTEEEYNGFMNSDVVIVNGVLAIRGGDMFAISVPSADSLSMLIVNVGVSEEGEYFYLAQIQSTEIPTKTSQLENDRNFVSSDNLRTINGQPIVGSGDIEIAAITVETDPVFSASPAASITEVKKTEWDGKQDAIADLDTIRSGAALGATALQRIDYPQLEDNLIDSGFYHSPDGMLYRSDMEDAVQESLNKADSALQSENDPIFLASPAASITEAKKAEWDNKVDKVDGKQLSTEDFTSALKTKLEGLSNYDDTELSEALSTLRGDFDKLVSGDTTTAIKTFNEVISFLDGIQDTQDLSSIIASIEQQVAEKMDKVTLATVATSGSYNDLSNKPTIPAAVTESTVSGWGFTKNTGTYSKPSTGIPKTDLASAVQTSLGKADTALQSYTEQYKGTVTGVKINGTTKSPSSGVVDLGTVITAHQDISGKQDKLVSGTNIKTINGTSILGSGNIVISGGGGSSSGSGAYAEVNHGTSDTTFTLTPNTFHVWDEVASLTLTLGSETAGVANEFLFQFNSGATATTLTLPDDIKWANDSAPTIAENKIYQVSILKGLASVLEFSNAVVNLTQNPIYWDGASFICAESNVASDVTVYYEWNGNPMSGVIPFGEMHFEIEGFPPFGFGEEIIITGVSPERDNFYEYIIRQ